MIRNSLNRAVITPVVSIALIDSQVPDEMSMTVRYILEMVIDRYQEFFERVYLR